MHFDALFESLAPKLKITRPERPRRKEMARAKGNEGRAGIGGETPLFFSDLRIYEGRGMARGLEKDLAAMIVQKNAK